MKPNEMTPEEAGEYLSEGIQTIVQTFGDSGKRPVFDRPLNSIPVVPVDNIAPFPNFPRTVPVSGEKLSKLIERLVETHQPVFLVQQKKSGENPVSADLYRIGVMARIGQQVHTPDGEFHAFVECFSRMKVARYINAKDCIRANVTPYPISFSKDEIEDYAVIKQLEERFRYFMSLHEMMPQNELLLNTLDSIEDPIEMVSFISGQMPVSGSLKQQALEMPSLRQMVEKLLKDLEVSIHLVEIKKEVEQRTRADLTDLQRESFLQQQLRQIQQELGQGADSDIEDLGKRAESKNWPEDTYAHFKRELSRLGRYNISSPDYSIQYTYLDKMLSLPWNEYSNDDFSLSKVEEVLNKDHFGLDKVKERILEQMAVIKLRNDLHAPILCLVGPPGVGKTSLGKSIADAMGREYQRISFGGMHDEAEIRGHRRTYIGAMPGRIIAALEKCKTSNPVIVLDEIDKICSDFKGDPSSALLEVLDPEQNSTFHDNYLDTNYDLSKVLFIATANTLSTISSPLLDRMEIISLSGYITAEKVEIAKRHLLPKLLVAHGFDKNEIDILRPALIYAIDHHTKESGVRSLEKVIAKMLRKIARLKVSGKEYPVIINMETAKELLGKEPYNPEKYEGNDIPGVVTGLAWTSVGGEILFIEASATPGDAKLSVTGNLGEVMKESATIASKYLKAHCDLLDMNITKFKKHDIHIHVPEGAIPKDGPSAGITMVTAIASALTGRKVRSHIAMTGEITLRGKVLPVGGIKEKIIAAKRAGIKEIILSVENRKDIEEINAEYRKGVKFTYVDNIAEVLNRALIR